MIRSVSFNPLWYSLFLWLAFCDPYALCRGAGFSKKQIKELALKNASTFALRHVTPRVILVVIVFFTAILYTQYTVHCTYMHLYKHTTVHCREAL
jgi:hypothetical protein